MRAFIGRFKQLGVVLLLTLVQTGLNVVFWTYVLRDGQQSPYLFHGLPQWPQVQWLFFSALAFAGLFHALYLRVAKAFSGLTGGLIFGLLIGLILCLTLGIGAWTLVADWPLHSMLVRLAFFSLLSSLMSGAICAILCLE